jgi:PAS domain S-box-containing protein
MAGVNCKRLPVTRADNCNSMGFKQLLDQSNLKMAHKGVVLVSLPLFLGLVFVTVLFLLLNQTEREAEREAHAKRIVSYSNALARGIIDSIYALSGYILTRSELLADRYDQTVAKLPKDMQALTQEVANDPEKAKSVAHLHVLFDRGMKLLTTLRNSSEEGSDPQQVLYIMGIRAHLTSLLKEFMIEQHRLVDSEKVDEGSDASFPVVRERLKIALAFALIFNIAMSFILAAYVARAITGRLNTLVDNAFRLARQEKLHSTLHGTDEIARLDAVFHQMAATIEEAAQKEQAIISNAADVICSLDQQLKFTAVSSASTKVWGYTPDELIGDRLQKFIPEEDPQANLAAIKQLNAGDPSATFENRFRTKDGIVKNMLWSAYWSSSDKTFFCVAHDITERKEAEELLKQSESRVRLILETMPVGLVIIDEQGIIETVNSSTEQMLGYKTSDLAGKNLATLFSDYSHNGHNGFPKLLDQASHHAVELDANRNNGEKLPVELSINRLQMREGPRLLTTMLDITERREIERLKQEFVAMVSHDIKSPLSSVISTLGLVNADAFGSISQRGKTIVARSEKEVVRLITMLNDLLLLEKIEAGKFELQPSLLELRDVLHESVEAVQHAAADRSIAIEVPDTNAHVYADGARLVQVLVNLLSNAIKFSPQNGVIKVSAQDTPEWLEVKVADQGRGIPSAYQKSIFEKFKQVEASDSREKGGTGLGLPICKMIIEGHGGTVGVDSEEGQGSTFWFRIPKQQS